MLISGYPSYFSILLWIVLAESGRKYLSWYSKQETPDVNLEPSSRSDNMSGGKALCWSEVPVVCQTHPLAGPNVACDASHPIALAHRWPAAYVGRAHHWIPNQTLSGVITVRAPNPVWSLALSHFPNSSSATAATRLTICCALLQVCAIPGSPAHHPPPTGWGPEITPPLCSLRPVDHSFGDNNCPWSRLFGGNQTL